VQSAGKACAGPDEKASGTTQADEASCAVPLAHNMFAFRL
jgi:hypothetical protein